MPARKLTQEQNYDQAMITWLHSLQYKERPLPTVFATPRRAFGQMERILRERDTGLETIPLPMGSVDRSAEEYDRRRFNSHYMYRVAANKTLTEWYGMKRPMPFNYTYTIGLWTKQHVDMNDLTTQMMLRLTSDYFYLEVDHSDIPTEDLDDGPTTLLVYTRYRGFSDTSVKDPGNRENRVLQRVFTFQVEGWRTFDADQYPVIEKVDMDIHDSDDLETAGALLGETVVSGEIEDL